MKRLVISLMTLSLILAACGEPYGEGGRITTRPTVEPPAASTTTTTSGGDGTTSSSTAATTTTAASAEPTPSTSPASTTSDPADTTSIAPADTVGVKAYFLLEGGGSATRPGPFLVPVYREIPRTQQVATAAVGQLLAGPTEAERQSVPALSSAVPAGTMLLGISIEDGLAVVDLTREFEFGGGTFSMTARLAQVVFTLTQFPTVEQVGFRLDGSPVSVFSGEGIVVDHPVSRDDFRDLTPSIFVDDPAYGAPVGNPMRVRGVAAVFEAQFEFAVTDWDGRVIAEGFAMTDNGMGWGAFEFTVPYQVDRHQLGSLIVFDHSAADGSIQDLREHPVRLNP